MKIQQLTVAETLASLRSSAPRLSAAEASRRLQEYGSNAVAERAQPHWGLLLARQFTHFFALLLWLTAAIAVLAQVLHPGQGMATIGAAIGKCRAAGIKVVMVTGDRPRTALAVAREIGLVTGAAPALVSGEQLGRLSDTQLQLALDAEEILFARVRADQKLRIVQALAANDPTYLRATAACL